IRILRRKRICRVEIVVTEELEAITMKFVCSRFGDRCEGSARVHPVLSGHGAGFQLRLLQRIWKRERETQVVVGVVVVCAVQAVSDAEGQTASDRVRQTALHAATGRVEQGCWNGSG